MSAPSNHSLLRALRRGPVQNLHELRQRGGLLPGAHAGIPARQERLDAGRMLRQGPAHDQDASQRAASSSYGLHSPALFMAINPLPSAQAGVPACQKGLDAGRMLRQGPAQDEGACQQPVSWCLGSRDLHLLWSQQLLGHFKWPDTSQSRPHATPVLCA